MAWQSFLERGKKDEAFVAWLLCNAKGGEVANATREEDISDHVDIWWTSPDGVLIGIDVKGMRRRSRQDASPDNDITWLEFRNVNGEAGWLYGRANYIAFRRLRSVVFVDRQKLAALAEQKVTGSPVYTERPNMCWKLYTRSRWGRSDLTCLAPLDEIEAIADFVIDIPKLIPISFN